MSRDFVWGSNSEKRKPYLVGWEKLCLPKEYGGLGLRRIESTNTALMMKWCCADMILKDVALRDLREEEMNLKGRDFICEDKVTWKYSGDGEFSVKITFEALNIMDEVGCSDANWKKIWNQRGPQRVKTFLWLLMKGKLLPNTQRVRRRLTDDDKCSRCRMEAEAIIHMI
ncbi:putative ribonuclease H protein [Senna tora]|uniref:Putative ribonuclease H protein n=1 Tax=Senna tora TaxID=362788 RepID=A0A834X0I8_9FABA|nr:putative ribonuclease H protein [Senna tora]